MREDLLKIGEGLDCFSSSSVGQLSSEQWAFFSLEIGYGMQRMERCSVQLLPLRFGSAVCGIHVFGLSRDDQTNALTHLIAMNCHPQRASGKIG